MLDSNSFSSKGEMAFIIGNGINRYNNNSQLGWDSILAEALDIKDDKFKSLQKSISLTEFSDLYNLNSSSKHKESMSKFFLEKIREWKLESTFHIQHVVSEIKKLNAPILTTNFDTFMADSLKLDYRTIKNSGLHFNGYYPWDRYYSDKELKDPLSGFGIWHINGMKTHPRSIRLSLSDYMGIVQKSRKMMHGEKESLFSEKDSKNWHGKNTWLHIIFNRSLCIFGLGLEQDEVFLRWLLIQRKKYFNRFPERVKDGYYIDVVQETKDIDSGKKLFLEKCGIKYLSVKDYKCLYEDDWLRSFKKTVVSSESQIDLHSFQTSDFL